MKKTILTALLAVGFTLVFSCGGTPPPATETTEPDGIEVLEEVVEEVVEEPVEEAAE